MAVLDASTVVDALGRGDRHVLAVLRGRTQLDAPHLLDVEVVSALRRLERAGELGEVGARLARDALLELPVRRHGHDLLVERVWQLREHVRVADAMYVALAEALATPLLTTDGRLARAHGLRCEVVDLLA